MAESDHDFRVRLAAFRFLEEQQRIHGSVLPRTVLAAGFLFEGHQVRLLGPQGIFKPAILEVPLSFTTVPPVEGRPRPYDDELGEEGVILYKYRGTDPRHRDNVGLRRAMNERRPLIYNFGIVEGRYLPLWPVYVVKDDPANLRFIVVADDATALLGAPEVGEGGTTADARRSYITVQTKRRLHQEGFRERVLRAYRDLCAVCRLRHRELLDAAHILPDGHPRGEPVVSNGLSLCKLHHAAFDRHIIGIRPDFHVELRFDILEEEDGPMLEHGLQGFQGTRITVPRAEQFRPNLEFLAERYEMFRRA